MSTEKKRLDKISNEIIEENIDQGNQILDIYKGMTLHGLSGESTNEQALARGHFGGTAAGIISLLLLIQKLLNQLGSIPPELVPVMEKTTKGIIWVKDEEKAKQQGKDYGYSIVQKTDSDGNVLPEELERFYFDYRGQVITSQKLAMFAYDVARATGSFQGETKQTISQALSNIKAVPLFPQMASRAPMAELYGQDFKDQDSD